MCKFRAPIYIAIGFLLTLSSIPAQVPQRPIFVYRSGFWLSLHHYLYVLGRVEAKMPDIQRRAVAGAPGDESTGLATLNPNEVQTWKDIVREYGMGLSRMDAVFDDRMVTIGRTLAAAGNVDSLERSDVEPDVRKLLERAAPIYRKAWWQRHETANRARIAELDGLVQRHGRVILAYVVRSYEQPWPPDGYPVQFTPFSNWAGAFSTRGRHLVFSSLDDGLAGLPGLETLFHEAMHQWDEAIDEKLAAAGKTQQKQVPGNLSHAMVFYTAGEAVRSVIPGHQPYAETRDMWNGAYRGLKRRLDGVWKPYLEGRGSLDETLRNLLN